MGQIFNFLNFNNLTLYLFSEMENPEGGSVNKRAGGGTGVEEVNVFYLMIRRGMGVAINNRIHFIEFSSDA